MKKIYGYARVSTMNQSLERQFTNIEEYAKANFPNSKIEKIYSDKYTGKTLERDEWQKLYKRVKPGDTIIFDTVSRLSRNAKEGFQVYQELFEKGVNLYFIKEPYINTETYKKDLEEKVSKTNTDFDLIIDAINQYLIRLAKRQIQIAFERPQKENEEKSQSIKEGMAKSDKQPGRKPGSKIKVRKELESKPKILKGSKAFGGNYSDKELMEMLGLSRNTFYKYKKELKQDN